MRDSDPLFSETAKRNLTKLDRKQDLKILYQVCVFFGPIGKPKMAMAILVLISWDILDFSSATTKLNLTKLDRINNSMSSTMLVFFRPIWQSRWPHWLLIDWDIFTSSMLKRHSYLRSCREEIEIFPVYHIQGRPSCFPDQPPKTIKWPKGSYIVYLSTTFVDGSASVVILRICFLTSPKSTKLEKDIVYFL